ncbi:hypothetical protein Q4Q35_20160 [Flavivirga aquimarina]|uniref:DUF4738 domain-containing protein n=1 Tax=Flavivirga aquimarina TaxID=2027862 RepID=A0ABT8WG39_9FLAO|nr:hypothetical protein [Flavivirga aquimarina]MDO5972120.1 hypothetical protein [Flavivirga aquimarina]
MEKQKLNIPKTTIVCLFFTMLLSCAVKQSLAKNTDKIEKNPQIIFLNYAIEKTPDGNRIVRFISKKIVEGRLKNHNKNSKEAYISGDLICYQLDKKSKKIYSTIIKNPLTKTIEFVDESKSFQMKKMDLDSAQFSLRLQLKPNTKYISIHSINDPKKKSKSLIKTKLN